MNYVPIRIRTLRPDEPVDFDVFIQLGQRYVHYIRNSLPFEEERLNRLKEKQVKKLYIIIDEEPKYLDYLDIGLDNLKNGIVSFEKKTEFVRDTMMTQAENIERNLENEAGYKRTEKQIEKIVDFLTSEKGALNKILQSSGASVDNFQHSATVANLSLGLASRLGISDISDLLLLGLAALVHDLGKSKLEIPPTTPRELMSVQQLKEYRSHPEVAVGLLSDKPYITPKLLRLVLDHEEIGEGSGFPSKKNIKKLSIISQVLNVCNEFDRYSMLRQIPHEEVYADFVEKCGVHFSLDHLTLLEHVINEKK